MKKRMYEDYDVFKSETPSKKNLKRVLSTIMIYSTISSSLLMLGDYNIVNRLKANSYEIRYIIDDEEEYISELQEHVNIDPRKTNIVLLHAVMKNENLDDQTKELLYNFQDLISDNPYINKLTAYNSLRNLKVEYTNRPDEYDETIQGTYDFDKNTIFIYQEKDKLDLNILIHELIHTIYTNNSTKTLPKYFIEGTTELLVNEYFSTEPYIEKRTYPMEVTMVKILCEMVGPEKVLEAYTKGDMKIISEEISNISGNTKTNIFLKNVESIFENYNNKKIIPDKVIKNITNFMNEYFMKKDNVDTDTLERYIYYKSIISLISNSNVYDDYLAYIIDNGYYQKPYFSNELIGSETKKEYIKK